jgi:hypothetical protein
MGITDKTRKILWGRSGNRCAICKRELVIDATNANDESVVGDECHIISSRPIGPRYDDSFDKEKLDSYHNLILLCRVHHKMVDDQDETYTADILRQMKANHEVWVSQKLTDAPKPAPVRFRRIKKNVPAYLVRLTTGREILNLVTSSYAFLMNHEDPTSQEEANLVGSFFQTLRDLADLGDDLEPVDRVNAAFSLTKSLEQLEEAGFYVFGGREIQLIEGGYEPEPSDWPIAILHVLSKNSEAIIHINADSEKQENQRKGCESN